MPRLVPTLRASSPRQDLAPCASFPHGAARRRRARGRRCRAHLRRRARQPRCRASPPAPISHAVLLYPFYQPKEASTQLRPKLHGQQPLQGDVTAANFRQQQAARIR
ncbi:hypothetical protein ACP4OV_030264 [Aristida adscensionis]